MYYNIKLLYQNIVIFWYPQKLGLSVNASGTADPAIVFLDVITLNRSDIEPLIPTAAKLAKRTHTNTTRVSLTTIFSGFDCFSIKRESRYFAMTKRIVAIIGIINTGSIIQYKYTR
jgi:hypothetical protein